MMSSTISQSKIMSISSKSGSSNTTQTLLSSLPFLLVLIPLLLPLVYVEGRIGESKQEQHNQLEKPAEELIKPLRANKLNLSPQILLPDNVVAASGQPSTTTRTNAVTSEATRLAAIEADKSLLEEEGELLEQGDLGGRAAAEGDEEEQEEEDDDDGLLEGEELAAELLSRGGAGLQWEETVAQQQRHQWPGEQDNSNNADGDDGDDNQATNEIGDNDEDLEEEELSDGGFSGRRLGKTRPADDGATAAALSQLRDEPSSSGRQERRLRFQSGSLEAPTGSGRMANGKQQQQAAQSVPVVGARQQKARQRRKFKRLNQLKERSSSTANISNTNGNGAIGATAVPQLRSNYVGRVKENERLVELTPKLRILNQVEVCDLELRPIQVTQEGGERQTGSGQVYELPFVVSWIDRVNGEATLEATSEELMNCEKQRNYTFKMRAIGCNGFDSNEAIVSVNIEDINEFSPEFERQFYPVSLDLGTNMDDDWQQDGKGGLLLVKVVARDQDCSQEFGSICSFELLPSATSSDSQHQLQTKEPQQGALEGLSIDSEGRIRISRAAAWKWRAGAEQQTRHSFQVIAYDCGGKKSQAPATVQVNLSKLCRPALKDVDEQISYQPAGGDKSPFLRARLDLCGTKCHRPNISMSLELQAATPSSRPHLALGRQPNAATSDGQQPRQRPQRQQREQSFHCDRESYSMVSKRRLCGARSRAIELLPPYSSHNRWISALQHQQPHLTGDDETLKASSILSSTYESSKSLSGRATFQEDEAGSGKGEDENQDAELSGLEEEDEKEELAAKAANEDDNLGAYSLDGAYGRQALESAATDLPIGSAGNGEPTSSSSSRQRGRPRWTGSGSRRLTPSRRISARSSPPPEHEGQSEDLRLRRKWQRQQQQRRRAKIDPSGVYRDQVYRFDGFSNSVVIPRSLYQTADNSQASVEQQQHFLFGQRHTISFWMRHSKFRFARQPEASEQQRGGATRSTREAPKGQPEGALDDELSKHVKEHLLCASSLSNPAPDPIKLQRKRNSGPSTPHQSHHGHQHQPQQHLYALFVRNCKLVLLMRRHFDDLPSASRQSQSNDSKSYLPAEWRWSLEANKACDNKWHLYTVNINYPNVELYVDGRQFEESYDKLVIVDELPLLKQQSQVRNFAQPNSNNRTNQNFATSAAESANLSQADEQRQQSDSSIVLSVGACWDGRQQAMVGHFRGFLSGLSVVANGNDDSSAIECLGRCTEALVSTAGSEQSQPIMMSDQMSRQGERQKADSFTMMSGDGAKLDNSLVSYQESQSKILLNGHDFLDVEEALTQVAYSNRRLLPSIGRRSILVETRIECSLPAVPHHAASGEFQPETGPAAGSSPAAAAATAAVSTFSIPIEPVLVEVNVLPSKSLPVISISGTPNIAREYGPFMQGIRPFASVKLRIKRLNLSNFGSSSRSGNENGAQQNGPTKNSGIKKQANSDSKAEDTADYIEDSLDSSSSSPPQSQDQGELNLMPARQVEQVEISSIRRRIEACTIKVFPPLNELHERLLLPVEHLDTLKLYWRQSHEGATIYGLDSAENYEHILASIIYRNQKPVHYLERHFRLACSDLNGRLVSNEYLQTVTIIHLKPPMKQTDKLAPTQRMWSSDEAWQSQSEPRMSSAESGEQAEEASGKPAMLRLSETPQVSFGSGQLIATGASSHELGRSVGQSFGTWSMQQNTTLDGIAMAFIVFVISLIVIMLVIALTNLKEPSIVRESSLNSHNSHIALRSNGEDSSTRAGCYYAHSELDYEDEEEVEEEEEEEEEEECDGELDERRGADIGCEVQLHRHHQHNHNHHHQYLHRHHPDCRLAAKSPRSATNTDLESLAWDDEQQLCEEQSSIVMNPLIHGQESSMEVRRFGRSFVAELRPDEGKARSLISNSTPKLAPSGEQDADEDELDSAGGMELEGASRRGRAPKRLNASDMIPMDELLPSSCSSSSSSSSSSDDEQGACNHRQQVIDEEDEDEEELSGRSEDHYELHHDHHFHHHCLRGGRQPLPPCSLERNFRGQQERASANKLEVDDEEEEDDEDEDEAVVFDASRQHWPHLHGDNEGSKEAAGLVELDTTSEADDGLDSFSAALTMSSSSSETVSSSSTLK